MIYRIQTNLNPMDGDNWIFTVNPEYIDAQKAIDHMNNRYDSRDARVVKIDPITGQISLDLEEANDKV